MEHGSKFQEIHRSRHIAFCFIFLLLLKRPQDTQIRDGTQTANFIDIEDMFYDSSKRKRGEEGSASSWTRDTLIPFQIYFVPMVDWNAIIPQEYLPSQKGKLFS
jgi:hypothetical protein